MKKNKMMRLASALLVLCLLTTSVISGTFAKYISDASVTDTARVAKWDIQLALGDDEAKQMPYFTDVVTVDLFSTAYASDTDGYDEDTVVTAKNDKIIAPGTEGSFGFTIQNASEVTAKYTLGYTVTNANIPIEFSVDGQTWETDITKLNVNEKILDIGSEEVEVTVQWRWSFEDGISTDEADTTLGLGGDATVVVTIAITAEQVD